MVANLDKAAQQKQQPDRNTALVRAEVKDDELTGVVQSTQGEHNPMQGALPADENGEPS